MQAAVAQGFRLSPQQEHRVRSGCAGRPSQCAVTAEAPLDADALKAALARLVARHESLRTRLQTLPGMTLPVQVIEEAAGSLELSLAPDRRRLVLSLPASIGDAGSLLVLVRELAALYAGGDLPDEVLQYADAAEILHDWLESGGPDAAAFWRGQDLGEEPPGACAPPPLALGHAGDAAVQLAERLGRSPADLLLAAYQAAIRFHTGRDAFAVGVVFDGRTCAEMEAAVGPFCRLLPVGAETAPETTLAGLIRDAAARSRAAAEWQDTFPQSRSRGFRFGFDFCALPAPWAGFAVESVSDGGLACGTLLTARLHPDGALRFDLAGLEAEALLVRLNAALAAMAATPEARLAELDLLTEAERRTLLCDFNRTERAPAGRLVHELFGAQAAARPEATAVRDGGSVLSYRDLDLRSNRLARTLSRRGVGPESLVGLHLDRTQELVVALLAVLKAGAAYVALDPSYPAERLALIAADAGLGLVLTTRDLAERPPDVSALCLDAPEVTAAVAGESGDAPSRGAAPDNLAYVLYTSGSTGRPKGVMVTHRALANYVAWAGQAYGADKGAGAPVATAVGFDLTVTSLLVPLASGTAVTMLPDEPGAGGLAEALRGGPRFSLVKITPAHLDVVSQLVPGEALAAAAAVLVVGGEALFGESLAAWREHAPAVRVVNEYGPTEATVGCAVHEVTADDPSTGPVPIGRPIANARLFVSGPSGLPVAAGVEGELLIGGLGLARGYLGRPDATAERFVPDPLSGLPGERLYRSGDRVRHGPRGLEFLGRLDDQVKIRGFRIEPGEVEAALLAHPEVAEAVVAARGERGERRLAAYFVAADPGQRPAASGLRAFLAERLPEHMVPAAFVGLAALPLTAHGKVDRKALPEPSASDQGQAAYAPPRTLAEEVLVEVWQRVLDLGRVGIDDHFFASGGDSIRSVQVLSLARERGIELTLKDLFAQPTIRGLAERAAQAAEPPPEVPPLGLVAPADRERLDGDVEDAYPLARLQAGMLFHSAYRPDSAIYNDLHSFELGGRLDAGLLAQAVEQVVARHPALRTGFDLAGYSEPLALVRRRVETPLACHDLSDLGREEQAAATEAFLAQERLRGFDWARAPLVRFHAHRLGDRRFRFTLSFHHSVLDGWSAASLLTELFQRYTALLSGRAVPPEGEPAASMRELVALEQAALRSPEALSFWRRHLDGFTFLHLPGKRDGEAGRRAAETEVPIPQEVSDGLKALAREAAVPLKSVLLAAHFRVLALLAGGRDVLTGVVAHGRPERADGDRVLGLFLNTLPLRMRLPGGSWTDLARAAFELERDSLPFRRFPLAELQKMEGGRPLFEVAFNFLHYHVYQGVAGIEGVEVLGRASYEETNFPLTVHFQIDPATARVRLILNYQEAELADAQVAAVGRYFQAALERMAGDPQTRHDDAGLLTEAETRELLTDWNGTAGALPVEPIPRLFARQAARRPEAVAVVGEGQSLTYAELAGRAERLARRLVAAGAGPEALVAVALPRSPEMVVGLLAVLQAGAAYLPLDPAYPPERLGFLLADSAASLVLTTAELRSTLPPHGTPVLEIDDDGAAHADLPLELDPRSLAYVIYTSGSTGRPKGVEVTHANVARLLAATHGWFGFDERDVWTLFHSYAFDFSVWEIWGALLYGGRLVVVPQELTRSPQAFRRLLADERVTVLNQTPSAFRQLIEVDAEERAGDLLLRLVIFGGEALDVPGLRPWAERHGLDRPRLVNMYGITETTVHVTYRVIAEADLGQAASPIGRPIPDLRLYALDGFGEPVPVGVPGELYVGGHGVARGYRNRPELTAERFVPDRFAAVPGARLYRSGDLVRYRAGGDLDYLGRADDQVKIRGFRIELGEIEAALAAHPAVAQAVVLAQGEGAERRLVAWVVPRTAPAPTVDELRRALALRLPEHMLPAAIVTLPELPLTANGKIDRRALPAPGDERPDLATEYVAAASEVEAALCRIWSQVLGIERVGTRDNFFTLGGDSILSIQVTTRAQREGIGISPRLLFEYPTVAELAAVAVRVTTAGAAGADQAPVVGALPLTPIERWFFAAEPAAPHHDNQALLLATVERLSPPRLAAALARLTGHHDALRLRFTRGPAGWEQTCAPPDHNPPGLAVVDLAALPAAVAGRAVELAAHAAQAGFDLERGPLQRMLLFDLGAEAPGRLFWAIHHLAVDGVSWRILLDDLLLAYRGDELAPKTASYKAWGEALVRFAESPAAQEELAFWLDRPWHEAPPLPRLGTANPTAEEGAVSASLERDETHALLTEVPQVYGTQINDALLAAFALGVGPWLGGDCVLVDLEGHGREEIVPGLDLSRTVGWFTSIFPVLLDLRAGGDPASALKSVKEQLRRIPRGGVGYGALRYLSPVGERLAALPRAEMSFNYLGRLDQALPAASPLRPAAERPGAMRSGRNARRYLLDWSASVQGERLHLTCAYGRRVHAAETIERLVAEVLARLRELIAHCREAQAGAYTPSDFPLAGLDQDQLDRLLAGRGKAVAR